MRRSNRGLKRYLKNAKEYYEYHNVPTFNSYQDAYDYLNEEVFTKEEFINNVSETAELKKVSYSVVYEIMTNHLTDILYEIDKKKKHKRKTSRISIYGYLQLRIGFAVNMRKPHLRNQIREFAKNKYNKLN